MIPLQEKGNSINKVNPHVLFCHAFAWSCHLTNIRIFLRVSYIFGPNNPKDKKKLLDFKSYSKNELLAIISMSMLLIYLQSDNPIKKTSSFK